MAIVVIDPPAPLLTPADISGSYDGSDATIALLIRAATEAIDGPDGWVGRCFGPQTLELRTDGFAPCEASSTILLPCPPLIDVQSVKYLDANGVERTVDPARYGRADDHGVYLKSGAWPAARCSLGSVRIRYRAGYDGQEGRGEIPARVKQAVILGVRALMNLDREELIRSETVEGVGATSYVANDVAAEALRVASERLLSGLRIYA